VLAVSRVLGGGSANPMGHGWMVCLPNLWYDELMMMLRERKLVSKKKKKKKKKK
jgi:hypothetical protein